MLAEAVKAGPYAIAQPAASLERKFCFFLRKKSACRRRTAERLRGSWRVRRVETVSDEELGIRPQPAVGILRERESE